MTAAPTEDLCLQRLYDVMCDDTLLQYHAAGNKHLQASTPATASTSVDAHSTHKTSTDAVQSN